MHNTTVSRLNPTTLRITLLTAASAVFMMALGFAPIPQIYVLLGASIITGLITLTTGPNVTGQRITLPLLLSAALPAVAALVVRDTALVLAVVPVLTFVTGAATWLLAVNRYTPETADPAASNAVPVADDAVVASADELMPKRQEKTATTTEDSSAAAA